MRTLSFDLNYPIIDFSNSTETCTLTIADSVEGIFVTGITGAGKTSGTGQTLAPKFLLSGYGGLVLCAKRDEKDLWIKYCKDTNRLDQLIIVEPSGNHRFDFLAYEASQKIDGISLTDNLSHLLKVVIKASEEKTSAKAEDSFWENSLDQVVNHVIDLSILAYGSVTVRKMYDILITAPTQNSKSDVKPKVGSYAHAFGLAAQKISKLFDQFARNEQNITEDELEFLFIENYPDAAKLKAIDHFFIEQYRTLSDKTRSIIAMSFSGLLFRLMKEPVYSLFCRHNSTFRPEDCYEKGSIILLNLPIKNYDKVGRDAQILFKYIWQRAMERRDIKLNDRPVFLWADEAQNFLHEHDSEHLSTARSSRISNVYMTQNLHNLYSNMGGQKYEHRVKALLGNFGTKIFHANTDIETNRYASDLIGEGYVEDESLNTTLGENPSIGHTRNFKLAKMVRPEEFVNLTSGTLRNNYIIEAHIHCRGLAFPNGFHHRKIIFKQQKQ